jgi:hypothetical protein
MGSRLAFATRQNSIGDGTYFAKLVSQTMWTKQ